MGRLALLVSRGAHNNLAQVASVIMAAVVSDMSVRVLFRDEAVLSLSKSRIGSLPLSEGYRTIEADYRRRLKEARMHDITALFREAKEDGDVKLYVCTSSLFLAGVTSSDLIPELDEPRGLVSFLIEEMEGADQVLSF